MTLHEATELLYDMHRVGNGPGMHPYIQSIGEAANENGGTIYVYLVREPRSHEPAIPSQWQGYHVKTRVIGRVTIRT